MAVFRLLFLVLAIPCLVVADDIERVKNFCLQGPVGEKEITATWLIKKEKWRVDPANFDGRDSKVDYLLSRILKGRVEKDEEYRISYELVRISSKEGQRYRKDVRLLNESLFNECLSMSAEQIDPMLVGSAVDTYITVGEATLEGIVDKKHPSSRVCILGNEDFQIMDFWNWARNRKYLDCVKLEEGLKDGTLTINKTGDGDVSIALNGNNGPLQWKAIVVVDDATPPQPKSVIHQIGPDQMEYTISQLVNVGNIMVPGFFMKKDSVVSGDIEQITGLEEYYLVPDSVSDSVPDEMFTYEIEPTDVMLDDRKGSMQDIEIPSEGLLFPDVLLENSGHKY